MKKVAVVFVAMLVLVCVHSGFAGRGHPDLQKDDRPGLQRTPTGPSVTPIPHNPNTGPQDPQTVQRTKLLDNYNRDIKKLDGQYRGLQDKLFKEPIGSKQRQEIQRQMEQIRKQETALSDTFNKDWNQTIGSRTPTQPTTLPADRTTPTAPSAPPSGGGFPHQSKSMADFFDQKLKELGGPGLDKRTKGLLKLGDNITDVWKALDRKYNETISAPNLSDNQKWQIETDIRQERRMLAEIYSAALSGRSPDPSRWMPQPGDPGPPRVPQAGPKAGPSGIPDITGNFLRNVFGEKVGTWIEWNIVAPVLAAIGLGGAP